MTGSEPDFGWFGEIFRYVRNVLMGGSEPINGWFGTYPNQVLKYPEYNSEIP